MNETDIQNNYMKLMDMKRLRVLPALAASLALAMLSACGGGKDAGKGTDTDTVTQAEAVAEAAEAPSFMLTSDALGPVRVGESLDALPDSVPGLYDSVTNQPGYDCETRIFSRTAPDGTIFYPFTVLDFGEGKVDVILLNDDQCGVSTPDGGVITLSSPFADVLSLPGVESRWQQLDGSGLWFWTWEGLWFQPSLENPGDEVGAKLYDSRRAPRAEDFPSTVTIGYIATGLPF